MAYKNNETRRKYYEENKDEINRKRRLHRLKHGDKIRARERKWHDSNIEKRRMQARINHHKHKNETEYKQKRKKQRKMYYKKHKKVISLKHIIYNKTLPKTRELRLELINSLGPICNNVKCLVYGGCREIKCLQIDHINGNGKDDLRKFKSSAQMYKYYLQNPRIAKKELQILCANCNWIKREENNENGVEKWQLMRIKIVS